jgi:hypothetical protein
MTHLIRNPSGLSKIQVKVVWLFGQDSKYS